MSILILYPHNLAFIFICFINSALCQELYIGCYRNFAGLSFSLNSVQSVSQCLGECKSQKFAAVKDGSSCYCGNITNTRVPSSNCNLPCSDNNGTCGGRDYYAVYTDIQTYYGCFKDGPTRDMAFLGNNMMTIDICYKLCFAVGNRFMGVQYADQCFCDRQYGKYGRAPESECNMTCNGDGNQICGGGYRNSVYSVGYIDGLNKSYSEVFHCYGGLTRSGACLSNSCQFGWKGSKCSQRDCTISNGNCGDQKCEEIKIGNQLISECVCNAGFQSVSIYDKCTDEDECYRNPCKSTETCINTVGSFKCSPGYNYFNQSGCEEQCIRNLTDANCKPSRTNNQYENEDKRIIILATFLAILLSATIAFAIALLCYTSKVRDLNTKLKAYESNIGAKDLTYNQLNNSNNPHDDHNYVDLEMQEK